MTTIPYPNKYFEAESQVRPTFRSSGKSRRNLNNIHDIGSPGAEQVLAFVEDEANKSPLWITHSVSPREEAFIVAMKEAYFISSISLEKARAKKSSTLGQVQSEVNPLDRFVPSDRLVSQYILDYNRTGLEKFSLWLMSALLDKGSAKKRLSDAMEDAIIASYHVFNVFGSQTVVFDADMELVIVNALNRRIPRLSMARQQRFLYELLSELKEELTSGRTLLVDGGIVECVGGSLHVTSTEVMEGSASDANSPWTISLEAVEAPNEALMERRHAA